jgi:hypothetical protein
MAIYDIYSKRLKKGKKQPDVFIYDKFPQELRIQIVQVINDAFVIDIGFKSQTVRTAFELINKALNHEFGQFSLVEDAKNVKDAVLRFILEETDIDRIISGIELSFRYLDTFIRTDDYYRGTTRREMEVQEAIDELNYRFKEHAVGYQYENGNIIKINNTLTHQEIIKPVLFLLSSKTFESANEEYLKAHEHFRHNRYQECIAECLKSFESILKIICDKKSWDYNQDDTSKKLISICFQNKLFPSYLQNQFTSLQNVLESGIPTIRNKTSGHGKGILMIQVDEDLAQYALNLTGSNIIYSIKLSKVK